MYRRQKHESRPWPANAMNNGSFNWHVQVDWDMSPPMARLQIRSDGGQPLLEQKLSLDTCVPVS